MQLQRRLSRRYKNKEYHKYLIVIPEGDIKKSEIKVGDELISEIKKGEIILRRAYSK
jgi:bifunctional DNA-binding transcriptional regulator/antitoxin component of YhaV-PrlF toxin-antitoxin module